MPFLVRLNRTHTTHNTHPQMIKIDDRNEAQKHTHRLAIVARDVFMSGWGQCSNGVSRCAWALHPDVNPDRVFNWVKNRKEMRNVNVVDLNTYKPKNTQHFHIYVCEPSHIAATY